MALDTVALSTAARSEILAATSNRVITAAGMWGAMSFVTWTLDAAPDLTASLNWQATLTRNVTLPNPLSTNHENGTPRLKSGQSGCFVFTQDTTGSRTITFGNMWKFPANSNRLLTPRATAIDVLTYHVVNSATILCSLSRDLK